MAISSGSMTSLGLAMLLFTKIPRISLIMLWTQLLNGNGQKKFAKGKTV